MTDARSPAPASLPIGMLVVLLIAMVCYLGMLANMGEMQNASTDAMGRGLASGFALVFMLIEWLLLAILLLIGGVKGEMPVWSAIVAVALVPLSAGAAIGVLEPLDNHGDPHFQLVPGLLAPVMAAYALWARIPALHRVLPPQPTSIATWLAVAILTAVPWVSAFIR